MNIDRLVLDYHACTDQAQLNRFWGRVPAHMEDELMERLDELFPPDPNECFSDPFRVRTALLHRGTDEFDATMIGRMGARSCVERAGRTEQCSRCTEYLAIHPEPED